MTNQERATVYPSGLGISNLHVRALSFYTSLLEAALPQDSLNEYLSGNEDYFLRAKINASQ